MVFYIFKNFINNKCKFLISKRIKTCKNLGISQNDLTQEEM
jgi:hypothetical protein